MPTRSRRPRRVAVPSASIQFADADADLINLSPSGALIRVSAEFRKGGEWPLLIEVPHAGQLWLHARVERSRRHDGAFILALSFVAPNAEARAALEEICSKAAPASDAGVSPRERHERPLSWSLPAFSVERLLRVHWSADRQCPECHSGNVAKEWRHGYMCLQCGRQFWGVRAGRLRVSL